MGHKMHTAIHVCNVCSNMSTEFEQRLRMIRSHSAPQKQVEEVKYAYIYIYIYIYIYDYVRVTIFILLLIRMSSNKDYFDNCIKFDEEN